MVMLLNEMSIIFKIIVCALLMFILGKERQKKNRFIGPRTLILIGCATTLVSTIAAEFEGFVLGGIMTGIGFLGAGVITKDRGKVGGLTTAALIWLAAIIGMAVGLELYTTAIFTTLFSYIVLKSKKDAFK